jgi:hypothetical protein
MSLNEQRRKIDVTTSVTSLTAENNAKDEIASQLAYDAVHHRSYHELGDQYIVERDALEQLRFNIKQLDDLHQRFSFMMHELSGLIKS